MPDLVPTFLENEYVALEPLTLAHATALEAAAADGELWNLRVTSVPAPGQTVAYIEKALAGQDAGLMLPFAVREKHSGHIVGSSRYYDISTKPRRLAIGYTWYAKRWQKTHVNTASKLLLLQHAFSTIGCVAVTFHTDLCNVDSQRAIEQLGAQREGVLRAHKLRTDGSLRDTVCYSIIRTEWPAIDQQLQQRLQRLSAPSQAPTAAVVKDTIGLAGCNTTSSPPGSHGARRTPLAKPAPSSAYRLHRVGSTASD